MTTFWPRRRPSTKYVVEAYRLDRYDNFLQADPIATRRVVEAYRLDRYDNTSYS